MKVSPSAACIFDLFAEAGHEVYLVGGAVRDLLCGGEARPDLDFATPTLPEDTERILQRGGYKTYAPGRRFGTIAATANGATVEVTTFRCEEQYAPGSRHPEVRYGGTITEDLARRDFTMNAIAMGADGNLVDPYDGSGAIRSRRIAVPGDIESTMRDDPLRLLRLARFIAQLEFRPTRRLADAARDLAFLITSVSRERWKRELDKLLVGVGVASALDFLMESRLLTFMLPELTPMRGFEQRDRHHHKDVWEHTKQTLTQAIPDVNVRWALLFHDCGKPYTKSVINGEVHFFYHEVVSSTLANSMMRRFRFSREQRQTVAKLVANHMRPNSYDPEWKDSAVRRLQRDIGEHWDAMLAMSKADITSRRPGTVKRSLRRLEELSTRAQTLTDAAAAPSILPKGLGHAIMSAWQLSEGPAVGRAMRYLHEEIDADRLQPGQPISYYVEYLHAGEGPLPQVTGDSC